MQPTWAKFADETSSNLKEILQYSTIQYGRHVDWFFRHRDAGIGALAAVIAAEVAVVGNANKLWWPVVGFLGVVFVVLGGLLAHLAIRSCARATMAALEHAALTAKVIWAMGLDAGVKTVARLEQTKAPLAADETLFVPRYLHDVNAYATTKDFVDDQMRKGNTAFKAANLILWMMGAASVLLGAAVTAVAVYLRVRGATCPG